MIEDLFRRGKLGEPPEVPFWVFRSFVKEQKGSPKRVPVSKRSKEFYPYRIEMTQSKSGGFTIKVYDISREPRKLLGTNSATDAFEAETLFDEICEGLR